MTSNLRRRIRVRSAATLAGLGSAGALVATVTHGTVTELRSGPARPEAPLQVLLGALTLAVLAWLAVGVLVVALDLLRRDGAQASETRTRRLLPAGARRVLVAILVGGSTLAPGLAAAAPSGATTPSTAVVRLDATTPPVDPGYLAPTTAPAPAARPSPGPAAQTSTPATAPHTHLVRPGDTLWQLAGELLTESGAPHDDARVARAVHRLYAANAAAIGADPDLIRPGTTLVVPGDLASEPATTPEDHS